MNIFELLVLGLALSADSFAASVSIGIELKSIKLKKILIIAILFALFQSLMPVIGYLLANIFHSLLTSIDHWLSFVVLFYLGFNMLKERNREENINYMNFYALVLVAIAVTLDAFTVGITYAILDVNLVLTIIINFIITFITTIIGLKIGVLIGPLLKSKAKTAGGLVLIALGFKILICHLH